MQVLTVTALTKYIKAKLEGDRHLASVYLKGEISNFKRHSRGHWYFTLKDEESAISAIVFAREAAVLSFVPKEGDKVLVKGRISLYTPSGSYSIQIQSMEPDGIGDLYLKYEALKKTLAEQGYFREDIKKPIPKFPRRIGVVTSPTGAVIQDIRHTVERRYRLAEIDLYPALVQGPGSASSIAKMIRLANQRNDVDVLIVGRGGGSIEDLWGFNEIETIEAIMASTIPIISAVGHETDFTISDFVADLRAPTPTAAAELATPNKDDLLEDIRRYEYMMSERIRRLFNDARTNLLYLDRRLDVVSPGAMLKQHKDTLERATYGLERGFLQQVSVKEEQVNRLAMLIRSPAERMDRLRRDLELIHERMDSRINLILDKKRHHFGISMTTLKALNPLSVMEKGFAVVTKKDVVMTSVHDLNEHDQVNIRVIDGSVEATITGKKDVNHGKENL
ncbi:MAG: exodeoxyribonuclease VII large subunit [Acholeplasmataceae bacterium]|nr:exodeoxyribonuclease VII large subunit [Acholeplasmataceae bacterium]